MPLDIERLRALRPGNTFQYLPSVGSTMTEAANLIQGGAGEGTVVLADEQTAGIGRLGRSWISARDAGIYASLILHLPLPPAQLPVASLLIGLATAESIQHTTHLACDLRWPNDVLINEGKVAGVLPQLAGAYIVAGIGINVNNRSFPDGLRTPATSLYLATGGREQSREVLLVALLESLDSFADLLATQGAGAIVRAFAALSTYVRDRRVIVEESGVRGVTTGLDELGFLLVRSDAGVTQRVSSGGIRPESSATA